MNRCAPRNRTANTTLTDVVTQYDELQVMSMVLLEICSLLSIDGDKKVDPPKVALSKQAWLNIDHQC